MGKTRDDAREARPRNAELVDRDRGRRCCRRSPPTPPDVRVRIRRFDVLRSRFDQSGKPCVVEVAVGNFGVCCQGQRPPLLVTARLTLLDHEAPQPMSNPPVEVQQHRWCRRDLEVPVPAQQVPTQDRDHLFDGAPAVATREITDAILETLLRLLRQRPPQTMSVLVQPHAEETPVRWRRPLHSSRRSLGVGGGQRASSTTTTREDRVTVQPLDRMTDPAMPPVVI